MSFFLKQKSRLIFAAGLILIAAYWYSIHPPGFGKIGYAEDLGTQEVIRMLMADNFAKSPWPHFFTNRMMAPTGISLAYYSPTLERDWLGGYLSLINPNFPWLWVYFGLSLLISYIGSGILLKKIGLTQVVSWALALLVVGLNVPRHFKTFHHYDHINQHWLYLSLLLDVWIWKRFVDSGTHELSLKRELWRLVGMLATFGTYGYFWSIVIVEWVFVRAFILYRSYRLRSSMPPQSVHWIQKQPTDLWLPFSLGLLLAAIDGAWFIPLFLETRRLGAVQQDMGWFSPLRTVLQPLWVSGVYGPWLMPWAERWYYRFSSTETLTAPGWSYLLLLGFGLWASIREKGWKLWQRIAPFLCFTVLCVLFISERSQAHGLHRVLQALMPLFKYFRVASRMGLVFPILIVMLVALMWTEIQKAFGALWNSTRTTSRTFIRVGLVAWLIILLGEASLMTNNVSAGPEIGADLGRFLESVKKAPGTTVLDMPFCVAGGNGVCVENQCPGNPFSAMPQLLTLWHDKKVYGTYQARLVPTQCEIYDRAPYTSWFDAWKRQRCLTAPEWQDFCSYLGAHSELSTVLVYLDLWKGADTPECRAEFTRRLGSPLDQALAFAGADNTHNGRIPTRIERYAPRCKF